MPKNKPRIGWSRLQYIAGLIQAKAQEIRYVRRAWQTEIVQPPEIHIPHGDYNRASIWLSRDGARLTGWFEDTKREYEYEYYPLGFFARWYLRRVMDEVEPTSENGW